VTFFLFLLYRYEVGNRVGSDLFFILMTFSNLYLKMCFRGQGPIALAILELLLSGGFFVRDLPTLTPQLQQLYQSAVKTG
jgi:hypothetical protein